jgi:hypothetical protein
MPHTDYARCRFTVMPSAETGEPAMLQIELLNKPLTALERPKRHIFFSLKKGTTWNDAEALVDQLHKVVTTMNVTEYAPGEAM